MKVYKPGTDCEVDFTVFANGRPCPEYVFPDAADEPSAAICFLPIEDDATITIQGTFTGSILHSRIDVLADGAFVANRTIEDPMSREGRLRYWQSRKLEVKTFLHVPDLNDRKTRKEPNIVEGNLVTKRLSPQELAGPLNGEDDASSIGVGSLALIVSMNQQASDTYNNKEEPAYPSVSLGHWRDNIADVVDSGIKPEHEMVMDVFPKSNPVKDKRANQFRREVKGVRYGSEPWAYMVFYYRTQAAIDAAGCVLLNESKALPPDDGSFIRASDQVLPAHMEHESTHSSPGAPTQESDPDQEPDQKQVEVPDQPISMSTLMPATETEQRRSMGLGRALLLAGTLGVRGFEPQYGNNSNNDSLFGTTDESNNRQRRTNLKADNTQSAKRPPAIPKQKPNSPGIPSLKPAASFSQPLAMTLSKESAMENISAKGDEGSKLDDLAAPSLSTFTPRTRGHRSAATPSAVPIGQPSPISPDDKLPPLKRMASHTTLSGANSPSSATGSPSASTCGVNKRQKMEEMQRKKAQMQADLQAKRERAIAAQKKLDDEKRQREEQQRLWAEEEARRQAEEARRQIEDEEARQAEEAMMAEMEALERENQQADEDMARLMEEEERDRMKWEEMVRARRQAGLNDE